MRYKLLFTMTMSMIILISSSQTVLEFRPYFSAIVVSNADSSAKWYQSLFELKEKEKMNDPVGSYKIIILESPTVLLELLELKNSIPRKEILKNKPDGTQVQGHFKIGFKVADIDELLKKLEFLKINVPQIWTNPGTKKRNFNISDPDGNIIQFFD